MSREDREWDEPSPRFAHYDMTRTPTRTEHEEAAIHRAESRDAEGELAAEILRDERGGR